RQVQGPQRAPRGRRGRGVGRVGRHRRRRRGQGRGERAGPVTAGECPVIDDVAATVYTIPTDQPEADGTLAWSSTTLVIAHVTGGGRAGLGYTYRSGARQAPVRVRAV